MEHIVPFIEKKLFLKVNREKTAVAYAGKIKFLGYGFYKGRKGFALRVHAKSKAKMKARVRELTNRRMVNDYEKWKADLKQCVVGWPTNGQPPTQFSALSHSTSPTVYVDSVISCME